VRPQHPPASCTLLVLTRRNTSRGALKALCILSRSIHTEIANNGRASLALAKLARFRPSKNVLFVHVDNCPN